jgi:hypothetical protein
MPLITCPDCGRQISDRATICIGCGGPVESKPVDQPAIAVPLPATPAPVVTPSPPGQRLQQAAAPPAQGNGIWKVILLVILIGAIILAASGQDAEVKEGALEMTFYAIGFLFSVYIYFAPAITAHRRQHPSRDGITLLNIFLGWTLVGWVAALVWAVNPTDRKGV